ncbi:hypothetical protein Ahy_A07g033967 isoform B [Arachis hypogaea]|uniref:Uncharacterized protein n=1 Tax=Arachis hypogaea TaxID=3818 RepID=A0A445CAY1_ARAHY|nr:hypothetical protein Ahy_A07g033967 isoform B [Arachis hypogaea]
MGGQSVILDMLLLKNQCFGIWIIKSLQNLALIIEQSRFPSYRQIPRDTDGLVEIFCTIRYYITTISMLQLWSLQLHRFHGIKVNT